MSAITTFPNITPEYGSTVCVYTFDEPEKPAHVWLALDTIGGGLRAALTIDQTEQLLAALMAASASQRAKLLQAEGVQA
jgi:hypothetical protein